MSSKIGRIETKKPTGDKHTGTLIFLHGSGGTGQFAKEWVEMLRDEASFPHIKILYPTAPMRPYNILNGESSNVWFDRIRLAPNCPEHLETIELMAVELNSLIDAEVKAGIPLNRIVIGGFSMGGAMALHMAYKVVPEIVGVFALSSFLNENSVVYKGLKEKKLDKLPAAFFAHGDQDDVAELKWGQETFQQLQELGVKGDFHTLAHTFHELKKKEMDMLFNWINELIPNK